MTCSTRRFLLSFGAVALATMAFATKPARAQNDWQFPDPYFGAFQHRDAGTPWAEERYRQEIAPQQPVRLHEHRSPRRRWARPRAGWRPTTSAATVSRPRPAAPEPAAPEIVSPAP